MPRKYTRSKPTLETDAFAAGLAATMRPMVQQLGRDNFFELVGELAELLGKWAEKNAPKAVAQEPGTGKRSEG